MKTKNIKGVDLTGRLVALKQEVLNAGEQQEDWLFRCEGGFGCSPVSMGRKIFGTFVRTNEECIIMRDWVAGVVKEEVADADRE